MAGGGFGVWNACANPTDRTRSFSNSCMSTSFLNIPVRPQFSGKKSRWGERCGGHNTRPGCFQLPFWPITLTYTPRPTGATNDEPNLQILCTRAYDVGVRNGRRNKSIMNGKRVRCPAPLVAITQLKRLDEREKEVMHSGKLTRTMDCCSPASSYPEAVRGNKLDPMFSHTIPCKRDGYTRV